MKQFWKSNSEVDLERIFSYLKIMANEMRAQRSDLAQIKRKFNKVFPDKEKETIDDLSEDGE